MRRVLNPVAVDKYALYNACLANHTTIAEVSQLLGHSKNYFSQVFKKSGEISMADYTQLKGMLKVTDDSLVKAVPTERSETGAILITPRPIKGFTLNEENNRFLDKLVLIGGGNKTDILNAIVTEYRQSSALAQTLNAAIDAVKSLTE